MNVSAENLWRTGPMDFVSAAEDLDTLCITDENDLLVALGLRLIASFFVAMGLVAVMAGLSITRIRPRLKDFTSAPGKMSGVSPY